jgi:hypothetical protein
MSEQKLTILDVEHLGEVTLAMAQATVQNALDAFSNKTTLHQMLDMSPSGVSRILSGSRRLSVRTMGEILACCGFEVRFRLVPLTSEDTPRTSLDSAML